jgi:protein-disulfide isomerase
VKVRTRSLVLVLAMVSPAGDAAGQEPVTELRSVLQKLDDVQAAQGKVLQQLESLERQVFELRPTSLGGQARTPPRAVPPATPLSIENAPRKGANSAGIVLLEYADFQCPYCGDFARRTLPELERRYVATGKVQLVFRNLPLPEIHPQALMAAEAAECAAQQGKFWEVHDALFMDQRLDEATLMAKVRAAGVAPDRFSACIREQGAVKVRQDLAAARALGLAVTPTFLIGRRQADGLVKVEHIITGVKDAAAFAALIDPMLAESLAGR